MLWSSRAALNTISSLAISDGSTTTGNNYSVEVPLRLQPGEPAITNDFFVYPSPARDLVQFHLNGSDFIESLQIFDRSGREVYRSGNVQWEHAELNLGQLPNGLYLAAARTTSGYVNRKFEMHR